MSIEAVRKHLEKYGLDSKIRELGSLSMTSYIFGM